VFRDMMQQALYERIGLKTAPALARDSPLQAVRRRAGRGDGRIPPVRRAVALLVQHPQLAQLDLPGGWERHDSPGIALLQDLIAALRARPETPSAALVERWEDPTTRQHLARLLVLDLGILDDAEQQFLGTLQTLAAEQRRSERETLLAKSAVSALSDEEKQRLRELFSAQADQKLTDS
jgi:DNA primase